MPDEAKPPATIMPSHDGQEMVVMNRFDSAFAIDQALQRKRYGRAKSEVERTMAGLVAELIMDVLTENEIVLAQPKRPWHTALLGRARNPHLTD